MNKKFEIGSEIKYFDPMVYENHLKRFKIGIQKNMRKFNIVNFKENSFFQKSVNKYKPLNLLILTKAEKKIFEIKKKKQPFIIKKKNLLDGFFKNEKNKENYLNKENEKTFMNNEKENLKFENDIEEKISNVKQKRKCSTFNIKNTKNKRRLTNAQKFTLLLN